MREKKEKKENTKPLARQEKNKKKKTNK